MTKRAHVVIFIKDYGYLTMLKMKKDKGVYSQLLSGGLELGESYLDAIVREIKEEIDYDIDKLKLIFLKEFEDRAFFYFELNFEELKNIKISDEHIGLNLIKELNTIPKIITKQSKGLVSKYLDEIIKLNLIENI